jgi:hypothetical protein
MKRAIALVACILTACGGTTKLTADEARDALSTAESAQIGTPPDDSAAQALTVTGRSEAAVGDLSGYYRLTREVASTVNVGVGLWIGLLKLVVHLPPTGCSGDTCTWGPWTSDNPLDPPNAYKLTVTKSESGGTHYDYKFMGAVSSSAEFAEIVSGVAYPSGQPNRGHGSFLVDFDQAKVLNPASNDTGKLTVSHDNVSALRVDCTFLGATEQGFFHPHHGERMNVVYAFDQNAAGGDLQVGVRYLDSGAAFTLHSRWDPNGAGRSDVSYELPTPAFGVSECWSGRTASPAFATVYTTATDPATGDEGLCAFASAPATLEVP